MINLIGISGKSQSGKDTVGKIIQYLTMKEINPKNKQSFNDFCKYYNTESNNLTLKSNKESISGYNYWKIKKFADKIKDIICMLINCTREELESEDFKNKELGEEWTKYGYANGFIKDKNNKPTMTVKYCDKQTYLIQKSINWQTAYKYKMTPRKLLQLLGTDCGRNIIHSDIWINATMINYKKCLTNVGKFNDGSNTFLHMYPNWIITDVRFLNEIDTIKSKGGINIRINRKSIDIKKNEHESETALDNYKFDYIINNDDDDFDHLIYKVKLILKNINYDK